MSDNQISIVSINSDENDLDVESYHSNIKKSKHRSSSRNRSYSKDKKRAPKGTGIFKADHRSRKIYKNYSIEYKRNILTLIDKIKIISNGKKPQTIEIDGIAKWIKDLRDEKIPVNTNDIIIKATEFHQEFKNKSMNALKLWYTRFLRRMGFSIRKIGHYA